MNKVEKVIKGLVILNKYEGCEMATESDILWAGPPAMVTEKDRRQLEILGWDYDEGYDSWGIST